MKITREQLIDDLYKESGFYKQSIKHLFNVLDKIIIGYYSQVEEDDEIIIPITNGVKIGCKVMPERERVNPKNLNPIIVKPTVKPFAKFSDKFREDIQSNYENKHQGN